MTIKEMLKQNKPTLSLEVFPPKPGVDPEPIQAVVREIAALRPAFISVTYGAGGGNAKNTAELARQVQDMGVTALAHLTCVGSSRAQVALQLQKLEENGIENVLALRGDLPNGVMPQDSDYHYAYELIDEIHTIGGFCVGAACYPEGHVECENRELDLRRLKQKVESGCDFLTTQMFFDNSVLYSFLYRLRSAGIDVPVLAGIMPVINGRQIARSCALSGTSLPSRFRMMVDRFGSNPAAMKQAGIAYATEQIIDLLANGVNNIHVYTMNKPDVAAQILHNLSDILR